MDQKHEAFCQLIESLHQSHARWARDRAANHRLVKLNGEVIRSYSVIEYGRLKALLFEAKAGKEVDFLAGTGFLFLKPNERRGSLLPVLSLKIDLVRLILRVRLALFTFDAFGRPAAMGFRFETPEGPGQHNYHHGQLIRSFSTESADLPQVPAWLSTTQPAFLMSARSPFSLFLGILAGLYGFGYLERELQGQRFSLSLREDMDQLKHGCGA